MKVLTRGQYPLAATWPRVLTGAVREARRCDVLVAGLEWAPTFVAVSAGRLARRPVVATVHTDLRRYREIESVPPAWWGAMRRALRRCAAVVAVSDDVRGSLADFELPVDRVHVIPNPVPSFGSRKQATASHRLLTVASLKKIKGVDLAVEAAAKLRDIEFEWTIVGDGPERPYLLRLADELGVAERVRFVGFQAEPERFFAQADVFVMPSLVEGSPLALLEAMSVGLPVVATACSRAVELHLQSGAGVVVPNSDSDALAIAIRTLLGNPSLRHQMGDAGRQYARRFELPVVARRYEELFLSVHEMATVERFDVDAR